MSTVNSEQWNINAKNVVQYIFSWVLFCIQLQKGREQSKKSHYGTEHWMGWLVGEVECKWECVYLFVRALNRPDNSVFWLVRTISLIQTLSFRAYHFFHLCKDIHYSKAKLIPLFCRWEVNTNESVSVSCIEQQMDCLLMALNRWCQKMWNETGECVTRIVCVYIWNTFTLTHTHSIEKPNMERMRN